MANFISYLTLHELSFPNGFKRFASRSWDAKRLGCIPPKAAKEIKAAKQIKCRKELNNLDIGFALDGSGMKRSGFPEPR
jgi:hypothetical protein